MASMFRRSAAHDAGIRNQKIGFIFKASTCREPVWENVEAPMLYSGVPKAEQSSPHRSNFERGWHSGKPKPPNQLSGGSSALLWRGPGE
jgi:ABC-type lipoprotein export system ATPase subunit